MEHIILASASPRRHDIFRQLGIPFSVIEPNIDETPDPAIPPVDQAVAFARLKVEKILEMASEHSREWIVGADTVIDRDNTLLGKPENEQEARRMLRSLSGRTHSVVTGFALYSKKTRRITAKSSVSHVVFSEISEKELDWYIGTGEWRGAAGSYRIQGKAAIFVSFIEGSYSSIAGLPIFEFYGMLHDAGYDFI